MTWTPERIERLKALHGEGLSTKEIAKELGEGITRRAVIGKLYRLAGNKDRRGHRQRSRDHQTVMRIKAGSFGRSVDLSEPKPPVVRVVHPKPELLSAPVPAALVPFNKLTPNSCRWPFGDPRHPDFGFCGAAKRLGSSYCEHHFRLSRGSGTASERRAAELPTKAGEAA